MAVDFLPRASGRRGRGPLLMLIAIFFIGICFYTIPPSITYRATHDYTVSIYKLKPEEDQSTSIHELYTQSIDQNHLDVIEEEMKQAEADRQQAERNKHVEMEERHRVRDEKQRKFKKLRDQTARARNELAATHPDDPPPARSLSIVYGRLNADEHEGDWTRRVVNNVDRVAEYIVDDANAPGLHLDQNRGREAMVYIKYIVEHYENLTDITAFVHSGNIAWHNNVLLHQDLVPTLNRLNLDHVFDIGYFNTRCDIYPGCPNWIPFNANASMQEMYKDRALDTYSTNMWRELFGDEPFPDTLSEPCCSQFAVSKEAIRAVPLEIFERIYRWLAHEQLDMYAGRQMEYLWQYIFRGEEQLCPVMSDCYCRGYDICFDNDAELQEYIKARQDDDASWVGPDGVRWEMKANAQDAMKRLEATLPYSIGMDSKFAKELSFSVPASSPSATVEASEAAPAAETATSTETVPDAPDATSEAAAETTSAETTPADSAPENSAPADGAPADNAPADSAPVEKAPVESASTDGASDTPSEAAAEAASDGPIDAPKLD